MSLCNEVTITGVLMETTNTRHFELLLPKLAWGLSRSGTAHCEIDGGTSTNTAGGSSSTAIDACHRLDMIQAVLTSLPEIGSEFLEYQTDI